MKRNMAIAKNNDVESIFQAIVLATVDHIQALVKAHLVPSTHKNFLLWILKENNPHRNSYLQMTGINKMVELNVALLSNLFPKSFQQRLSPYLGAINAYFFFEVVSDNLAIGLSSTQKLSSSARMRQEVLFQFNTIMEQKLTGNKIPASVLLNKHAKNIKKISSHKQSLAKTAIKKIAASFVTENPGSSLNALDHSILDYLILNIEACIGLSPLVLKSPLSAILNQQLKNRYTAMNALLQNNLDISPSVLANYGEATILVTPTLIYIISAIDSIEPIPHLKEVLANGVLLNSIAAGSSIIRMDNDIGTKLLDSDPDKVKLREKLLALHQQDPTQTIFKLLLEAGKQREFSQILTRIRKDIVNNEFNICLSNINNSDTKAAIDIFYKNLGFFSELNHKKHQLLSSTLEKIDQTLKSSNVSQLILRIVKFHEHLYSEDFESEKGEYAISTILNKH